MTAAWHRLAFIAACAGFVLGLVLLAEWQTWWVGLLTGWGGVLLAAGLAQDWSAVDSADRPPRQVPAPGDPGALPLPPSPRKRAEPTYADGGQ